MSWHRGHLEVIQLRWPRLPPTCTAQAPLQSLQLWVVCILGPTGCHPGCLQEQRRLKSLCLLKVCVQSNTCKEASESFGEAQGVHKVHISVVLREAKV